MKIISSFLWERLSEGFDVDQNGSILMLTTVARSLIQWSSGTVWLHSYFYPLLVPKTGEMHPELLRGVMHGLW